MTAILRSSVSLAFVVASLPLLSQSAPAGPDAIPPVHSPVAPAAALGLFQVDPGLRVQLVAAEPLVVAPCAIAWDERGRMFVAENRGYPLGAPDGQPAGVIALLEDTDGDGQMDRRFEFATSLSFPNGLLPWNGGVIVTCAPDVLFLKDTNGDGRADVREVWLTGFDDKNTTQLRVSHPTLGPDGWIYLTSGWTGESTVRSPKYPGRAPVKVRTDSRFHPVTLEFEPVDGRSQFGQSFDDAGNRFICFNRVHIQHVVISSQHLQRNPHYVFSETIQDVPATLVPDLLGGLSRNVAAHIYPISDNLTTADSHAGQFSAACGITIFRGDGLLPGYYGDAFACDPTGNLVHRDKLSIVGATFSARMANEPREFLASPDNWFRPVNLATGPDGALYVCDMYRKTIEHPQYLPDEVRKRTDFESGKTNGRIWRVVAGRALEGGRSKRSVNAAPVSTAGLVEWLGHPNLWHRETAQRLLLERRAPDAVSLLLQALPSAAGTTGHDTRMAADSDAPGPHTRVASVLNTLFAMTGGRGPTVNDRAARERYSEEAAKAFGDATLLRSFIRRVVSATLDPSPAVRVTAFRILGAMPGEGTEIPDRLHEAWAVDPSPAARFHAALYLGNLEHERVLPALARLARQDGRDRWMRAAVLSGLRGREHSFFETFLRQTNAPPTPEFIRELCRLKVNQLPAVRALTDADAAGRHFDGAPSRGEADAGWQIAGLAGLCDALRGRAGTNVPPRLVELAGQRGEPGQRDAAQADFQTLLARAAVLLDDPAQPLPVREAAMTLLLHEQATNAFGVVTRLFRPGELPELQQAAARALLALPGVDAAGHLLTAARWRQLAPAVRATAIGVLVADPRHAATLLGAIEEGAIPRHELSRAQRDRLLKHRDAALKGRAEKLFAAAGGDRMKTYEQLKPALQMKADAARGREIFTAQCASCHRLDRDGFAVGPDLFSMRTQPKDAILLHVVVPNYEINPGFAAYEIETTDGRSLFGLLASETASTVSVRQAQGIEESIRRSDISSMVASTVSLMPDELEKSLSVQEMADLLAYLKGEF